MKIKDIIVYLAHHSGNSCDDMPEQPTILINMAAAIAQDLNVCIDFMCRFLLKYLVLVAVYTTLRIGLTLFSVCLLSHIAAKT